MKIVNMLAISILVLTTTAPEVFAAGRTQTKTTPRFATYRAKLKSLRTLPTKMVKGVKKAGKAVSKTHKEWMRETVQTSKDPFNVAISVVGTSAFSTSAAMLTGIGIDAGSPSVAITGIGMGLTTAVPMSKWALAKAGWKNGDYNQPKPGMGKIARGMTHVGNVMHMGLAYGVVYGLGSPIIAGEKISNWIKSKRSSSRTK